MTTLLVKITHRAKVTYQPQTNDTIISNIRDIRNIEIIPTIKSKETLVKELWNQYFMEMEQFFFEEYICNPEGLSLERFQKLNLEEKIKGMESDQIESYLDRIDAYTQLRDDWLNCKVTTYDQDKVNMPNTKKKNLRLE